MLSHVHLPFHPKSFSSVSQPSRRYFVNAAVSYGTEAPPIPPPPPPPFPSRPQGTGRRQILQTLGIGGLGTILGYGSSSLMNGSEPLWGGVTTEEKDKIDAIRFEAKFRRDYEGRVWVQAKNGDWYELRVDARMPGVVLLRNPDGILHALSLNGIQQIDLTDDFVVAAITLDGFWEAKMKRVQQRGAEGQKLDVVVDRDEFHNMVSIQGDS